MQAPALRRLARLAAPALSAWAVLAVTAPAAHAVTSSFDTGSEGWTVLGDAAGPVTWVSSGGNPGGHIIINDAVIGGITYFVAPASFGGNRSAALGSLLRFDLMQAYSGPPNQFNAIDVLLAGGGQSLVLDLPNNPANGSWTSYAVPLVAGSWRVGALDGPVATTAQLAGTLASLTTLHIRAEYQTGADTGKLDNVSLVPEPGTWGLLAAGLALLGWRLRPARGHRG